MVDNVLMARNCSFPNRFALRIPVFTKWNLKLFGQLLHDYHDQELLEWLKFGWPLGRAQQDAPVGWAHQNHMSARHNPSAVSKYIEKEIGYGTTIGPFPYPPFGPPVGKCPISTRRKRDSSEFRILMDFSWPVGFSINDQISSTYYLGTKMVYDYPSVDDLAQHTAKIGVNALLWKSDIRRCFKQILICWRDVPLQGFVWNGNWYFDTSLIMGCRSAPYIAMRCSKAIKHIHNQMGYFSIAYADDFSGAEHKNKAWVAYKAFVTLLRDLGVEEAADKSVPPAPVIVFLGTGIDAESQTIFVTPDRLLELQYDLEQWRYMTWCTRNQLESIIGKLQFCTNCVRAGRVFINRLLNELRQMVRHRSYVVSEQVRLDLKWWWDFLPRFQSSYILWPEQFMEPGEILQTDSSKRAIGAICKNCYFHSRFPDWMEAQDRNIADLEMLGVLFACKKWTQLLQKKKIVIRCDNMAVVEVINNGKTRSRFLQAALRELTMLCCLNSIEILCVHLPGRANLLPDCLSRWYHGAEYRRMFRRYSAGLQLTQTPLNPKMYDLIRDW